MPRTISEKALLTMKASQYMNASQRQFFRKRLAALAHDCEQHIGSARNNLQTPAQADPLDAAVEEETCRHQLRFMARQEALLGKVRGALRRLENGDYGDDWHKERVVNGAVRDGRVQHAQDPVRNCRFEHAERRKSRRCRFGRVRTGGGTVGTRKRRESPCLGFAH